MSSMYCIILSLSCCQSMWAGNARQAVRRKRVASFSRWPLRCSSTTSRPTSHHLTLASRRRPHQLFADAVDETSASLENSALDFTSDTSIGQARGPDSLHALEFTQLHHEQAAHARVSRTCSMRRLRSHSLAASTSGTDDTASYLQELLPATRRIEFQGKERRRGGFVVGSAESHGRGQDRESCLQWR